MSLFVSVFIQIMYNQCWLGRDPNKVWLTFKRTFEFNLIKDLLKGVTSRNLVSHVSKFTLLMERQYRLLIKKERTLFTVRDH